MNSGNSRRFESESDDSDTEKMSTANNFSSRSLMPSDSSDDDDNRGNNIKYKVRTERQYNRDGYDNDNDGPNVRRKPNVRRQSSQRGDENSERSFVPKDVGRKPPQARPAPAQNYNDAWANSGANRRRNDDDYEDSNRDNDVSWNDARRIQHSSEENDRDRPYSNGNRYNDSSNYSNNRGGYSERSTGYSYDQDVEELEDDDYSRGKNAYSNNGRKALPSSSSTSSVSTTAAVSNDNDSYNYRGYPDKSRRSHNNSGEDLENERYYEDDRLRSANNYNSATNSMTPAGSSAAMNSSNNNSSSSSVNNPNATTRNKEDDLRAKYYGPNSQEGSARPTSKFESYAADAERNGISLSRKSARYDDDREEEGDAVADKSNNRAYGTQEENILSSQVPSHPQPVPTGITAKLFTGKASFVMQAHPRGFRTEHVQCVIERDRSSISGRLYPTYELILEENRKPLIVAQKKELNMTSNYHLFDMTRGQVGSRLSKKSGNYLGKLRALNSNRTEYVVVGSKAEREAYAAIVFDRMNFINQLKEGSQPRKMTLLIPHLDQDKIPVPYRYTGDHDTMAQLLKKSNKELESDFYIFESKDPVFENGNYRLNFHGRVSIPSVKNFQLVSADNIDDIICQFGKIGEDRFHLDFKGPLNAFQAFSLALCQFNL